MFPSTFAAIQAPLILEFGSRSGSWLALCFFAAVFGLLGWATTREIRRRSAATSRLVAVVVGLVLFAAPISAVYASMISGFYELQIAGDRVRLVHLVPAFPTEVALGALSPPRATPSYRDRWQMELTLASGERLHSARAPRSDVSSAIDRLNKVLQSRVQVR